MASKGKTPARRPAAKKPAAKTPPKPKAVPKPAPKATQKPAPASKPAMPPAKGKAMPPPSPKQAIPGRPKPGAPTPAAPGTATPEGVVPTQVSEIDTSIRLEKSTDRGTIAQIEIVKDGHYFVARTTTEVGSKEYKNTVFEDMLTEMIITLQEQLADH
jgi:hypothetical protein